MPADKTKPSTTDAHASTAATAATAVVTVAKSSAAEAAFAERMLKHRDAGMRVPAVSVGQRKDGKGLESHMCDEALGSMRLCAAMGTLDFAFADWALGQLSDGVLSHRDRADEATREVNGALAALHAMAPTDPLEAMLISQMVACHAQAMRGLGRMRGVQSIDQLRANERAANAFLRTYAAQMEALKRYRSKGEQTVRVERVYVGEGGQAIVGNVQTGGGRGDLQKTKGNPMQRRAM